MNNFFTVFDTMHAATNVVGYRQQSTLVMGGFNNQMER